MNQDLIRCYRPLIIARRGAVAANHPLAAQAALPALRAGSNAVNATVTTALPLAVVEPNGKFRHVRRSCVPSTPEHRNCT